MDNQRIRVVLGTYGGSVSVEADDDVTVDEVIAYLDLEFPKLAAQMRRTRDIVRRAQAPGISDEPFWQEKQHE